MLTRSLTRSLTRPLVRGLTPGEAADPLANIPTLLDLRTHKGDKVFFGIAGEGDPNPTWTGVVGSATQPTSGKQPITMLASDGTPYLDFTAASSQWMSIGEFAGGEYYYTVLVRSKTATWNSYFGLIDAVNVDSRWGYCEAGNTYINASYAPRQNGVTLATPTTPLTDIDEWNVITIRTPAALTSIRGLAQLLEVQYGDVEYIAAFIYDGVPTEDHIQTVETYYQLLKPEPEILTAKVVGAGDSLTRGYGISPADVYGEKLTTDFVNLGHDGWTTTQALANIAEAIAEADPAAYFIYEFGVNNLSGYGGTYTPEEVYDEVEAYMTAIRPYFLKVFVVTVTTQNLITTNPDFEADRVAYNDLLKAGFAGFCDGLIKLDEIAAFFDPNNGIIRFDGLHYTVSGHSLWKDATYTAIAAL